MTSVEEKMPSKRQPCRSDTVSTTAVLEDSDLNLYSNPFRILSNRQGNLSDRLSSLPIVVSNTVNLTQSERVPGQEDNNQIDLDLETLQGFEVVNTQFQQWGVTFRNAIALQPSNPAYPPRSGTIVLIAGPKSGWMEVMFTRAIKTISCYVTSSRRITLSAFDRHDRQIAYTELPEANLANSNSHVPPNALLSVKIDSPEIYRISFSAFDGQFSIDDFYFEFA